MEECILKVLQCLLEALTQTEGTVAGGLAITMREVKVLEELEESRGARV